MEPPRKSVQDHSSFGKLEFGKSTKRGDTPKVDLMTLGGQSTSRQAHVVHPTRPFPQNSTVLPQMPEQNLGFPNSEDAIATVMNDGDPTGNPEVRGRIDIPELEVAEKHDRKEIERLLDIANSHITTENYKKLGQLFKSLTKDVASTLAYKLLMTHLKDNYRFGKILAAIGEKHEISKYVRSYEEKGKTKRVITLKGVEILIDYLKKKNSLKMDCVTCHSYSELREKLIEINNDESNKNYRIGYIIEEEKPYPTDSYPSHVFPVYIEKKDGALHCVVTDSMGTNLDTKEIMQELGIQYYTSSERRQFDNSNCPIFALRDLVQISKDPDFLAFVQEQAESHLEYHVRTKNLNDTMKEIYRGMFDSLPSPMMKVTQSLRSAKRHKFLSKDKAVPSKKTKEGFEKFSEVINRHKGTMEGKDGKRIEVNTLIAMRFKKYERVIIAKLVGLSIKEKQRTGLNST